jgi:hypothetical protein
MGEAGDEIREAKMFESVRLNDFLYTLHRYGSYAKLSLNCFIKQGSYKEGAENNLRRN